MLQVMCKLKMGGEMKMACCVKGYHMYKEVWEAVIGEVLVFHMEPTNAADRYAVAVRKAATIIGHLPNKLLRICSLFLRREGSIRHRKTIVVVRSLFTR